MHVVSCLGKHVESTGLDYLVLCAYTIVSRYPIIQQRKYGGERYPSCGGEERYNSFKERTGDAARSLINRGDVN
jgi:hypothetical protein